MQAVAEVAVLVVEEAADVKVRKLSVVRFDHHVEQIYLLFSKVELVRLKPDRLGHPLYTYSLRTNLVRILTYLKFITPSSWCNYKQLWYPSVGSAIQAASVIYPALCARRLLAHAAFTFCYPLGIYRRGLSPGRFLDLTNVSSFTRLSVRTV
jgi:hypothetical protein